MDVQKKLDEIVDAVGNARSMPMSASCVVNRAELLAMLEELRAALPGSLAQAEEVIGGHEQLTAQARDEADRIIREAHAERSSLISETVVARRSQEEADRILSEARRDAEEIRVEADDYVDSKLANFEVVLTKTIGSVDRGREKLLGRAPGAADGNDAGYDDDPDAPEYSTDPGTLVRHADDYVDAKLGAFEAVLSKTLEAVGRGRQKLLGAVATDELGAHMAAQDAAGGQGLVSDSDFLADLAEHRPPARERPAAGTPEPLVPEPAAAADAPMIPAQAQQPLYQHAGDADAEAGAGYGPTGYETGTYEVAGMNGVLGAASGDGMGGMAGQDTTGGYPPAGQGYAQDQTYGGGYPQQDAYGYQQDPYAYQQGGYDPTQQPQQAQHPDAYGQDPGQEYGWQQPQDPAQQQAALDETSLFDTSMIDMEALRRYEEGR